MCSSLTHAQCNARRAGGGAARRAQRRYHGLPLLPTTAKTTATELRALLPNRRCLPPFSDGAPRTGTSPDLRRANAWGALDHPGDQGGCAGCRGCVGGFRSPPSPRRPIGYRWPQRGRGAAAPLLKPPLRSRRSICRCRCRCRSIPRPSPAASGRPPHPALASVQEPSARPLAGGRPGGSTGRAGARWARAGGGADACRPGAGVGTCSCRPRLPG